MERLSRALSEAGAIVASGTATVVEQLQPLLVRIGRTCRLLAWRIGITVGPAMRTIGRHVAAAVNRIETLVVAGILGLSRGVMLGVQRAEELLVPALQAIGMAGLRLVERAERRAVPALQRAGSRTADAASRGQGAVAAGVAATGRGLVGGVGHLEAKTVPGVAEAMAGGGVALKGRPGDQGDEDPPGDDEFVPPASQLEPPPPPEDRIRGRLRSALASTAGMFVTAGIVVLVVALVADLTVGTAVRDGSDAVGVSLVLPESATLEDLNERSYIYAADGRELDVLDREENRRIVDLEEIPRHVQLAVIAAEDKRFYEHDGYDVEGIGRALVANVEAGDITQGGSTITQQLAKSAVGNERTLTRKLEELAYAVALEREFSKDELLEQYLNQTFFGEASYGVAAASEEYFGITDISQLTLAQGALLAAMIREPNNANPRSDPATATWRRNATLDTMVAEGFATREEAEAAKAAPLGVIENRPRTRPYDFVADSVVREFLNGPEFAQFGANAEEREQQLWFGGLRIRTSLDPRLQDIAAQVLDARYPTDDPLQPTGAIVSVEPASGRILAAHSALDYSVEQLAIPTQARRQPGSAAKPFVFAEALGQGFPTNIALSGRSPTCYPNIIGWDCRADNDGVRNYGNSQYGTLDMPTALRNSVNTATVQLSLVVGIDRVVDLMGRMGINTLEAAASRNANTGEVFFNPSIALGGFTNGVTPLEMASAYAVFANGGTYVKPHFIDRIEDRNGNILYAAQPQGQQVLDPAVNALMVDMMQGAVVNGTGTRARIPGWPVAGKTGTTQDSRDAWFVGYTPTMATAMWMGVPQANIPMRSITGGSANGPIVPWQEFMQRALEGVPPVPFPSVPLPPDGRVVPGQPTNVPNVTGRSLTQALQDLGTARLFGAAREVPSQAPAGTVIGQSPRAGSPAIVGDTITLNVSTGFVPRPDPPPPAPAPAPAAPAPEPAAPAPEPAAPAPEPPPGPPPGPPGQPDGRGGPDPGRGTEEAAADEPPP